MLDMLKAFILRQARRRLSALSDHQLKDIGLTRFDAVVLDSMLGCTATEPLADCGMRRQASSPARNERAKLFRAAVLCSAFLAVAIVDAGLPGPGIETPS